MRFLIDENLSWRLAELLIKAGHDAVHVRDLDLEGATDPDVMALAAFTHDGIRVRPLPLR